MYQITKKTKLKIQRKSSRTSLSISILKTNVPSIIIMIYKSIIINQSIEITWLEHRIRSTVELLQQNSKGVSINVIKRFVN